jgi:hypothetical protein
MARTVGGHVPGPTLAAVPKSGWTDAAIGNLVIWDTTANMAVDECVADENPVGQLIAVNPAKSVLTVELFAGGMVVVLPYSGNPSRGDKVEADGTADSSERGRVRTDNTNGAGRVVAVDRVPGFVDVFYA